MRLAVVLFNLGGPGSLQAVEPFLRKLFSDPAILPLPAILRLPLAWAIARKRGPIAREIYRKLGGASPILEETEAQARALEDQLTAQGHVARCYVAMRCSRPSSSDAAAALKSFGPDSIVLLPLYPQYSGTTTGSSLADWARAAGRLGKMAATVVIKSYPTLPGFIEALAQSIHDTWKQTTPGLRYRLLLSAHGLPQRVIAKGDPYQREVEQTAYALAAALKIPDLDWILCYQSRVGPLAWIGPATDIEIVRAGREGLGVVVAPIAFVSEHSETLVELDIEYAALAKESGVPHYLRAPAVGTRPPFISALAELVVEGIRR